MHLIRSYLRTRSLNQLKPNTIDGFDLDGVKAAFSQGEAIASKGTAEYIQLRKSQYNNQTLLIKRANIADVYKIGLVNEIKTTIFLQKYLKTTIRAPKLIMFSLDKIHMYIVYEFVNGKQFSTNNIRHVVEVYKHIIDQYHELGPQIKASDKNLLVTKGVIYIISTFPVVILLALRNVPNAYKQIARGAYYFITHMKAFRSATCCFTHRDLNLGNILIHRENITVLDYQYASLGIAEYEYASILRSALPNMPLFSALVSEIKGVYCKNENAHIRLRMLCIYYAMMGLIDKNHTEQRTKDFMYLLDISPNL